MRTQVTITDLSFAQWDRLNERLLTSYGEAATPTVCAVFEQKAQDTERHVQIPMYQLATLMAELAMLERAQAALTPDALPEIEPEYVAAMSGRPVNQMIGRVERLPVLPTAGQVRNLAAELLEEDLHTRPAGADQ